MIRRQFISVSAITGGLLFSGCVDSLNWNNSDSNSSDNRQDRPEGGLMIFNDTNTNQAIEVLLRDEAGETVFSEQYELEADQEHPRLQSFIAEVERTYQVEVTTNDHQEEFEWEVDPEKNVLSIRIRDSGIRFRPLFEG